MAEAKRPYVYLINEAKKVLLRGWKVLSLLYLERITKHDEDREKEFSKNWKENTIIINSEKNYVYFMRL